MSNGSTDKFIGWIKEVTGSFTGNNRMEAEGKVRRAKGNLKQVVSDTTDKVKGAAR